MKPSCTEIVFLRKEKSTLDFVILSVYFYIKKKPKTKQKSIRSTHSGSVNINTLPLICIKEDFSCSYSQ